MAASQVIVVRYGELSLKGNNRGLFEQQLVRNIHAAFKAENSTAQVKRVRGRILITDFKSEHQNNALKSLRTIFGIVSYSHTIEVESSTESVHDVLPELLSQRLFSTFRVSVARLDKTIAKTSQEWERELGAYIVTQFQKKVSLKNFDVKVCVELFNNKAYVFTERFQGCGGLPVGVSERVAVLLDDQYSFFAAWLMLKRGCMVLLMKTARFTFSQHLLQNLQLYCPFPLSIKEMRSIDGCGALSVEAFVVSETLQTLKDHDVKSLILRPLVGYTQDQLDEKIEKWQTLTEESYARVS